jgi:hypothetical protein
VTVEVEKTAQLHEAIVLRRLGFLAAGLDRGVGDTGNIGLVVNADRDQRFGTGAVGDPLLVNSENFLWVSSIA